MANMDKPGTVVSDDGQVKREPAFAVTRAENDFGVLAYRGTPKTMEEMDAGVLAEAARQHGRD